jgi:FAD/FMN-containing dehydrogenase
VDGLFIKLATEPAQLDRLAHENRVLKSFVGWPLARRRRFWRGRTRALLVTEVVAGRHLVADDLAPNSALRKALDAALAALHEQGWVHGDLAPTNAIWDGTRAWLIDLEHAAPIGAALASLPARGVRPGLTHPDVIWGRGKACPEHDFWTLARMTEGVT